MNKPAPRHFVASLALLLLLFAPAPAQERGLSPSKSAAPAQPRAQRRIGLVVGNSAYADAPLKNPVNDARAVAEALRQLGFEVTHKENLTQNELKRAVREFGAAARTAEVRLFYYAGHAAQVAGENYLLPVGATVETEQEVEYESVNAGLVLAQLAAAPGGVNIVILDACRNNPFARGFRSATRGLAQMQAPTGTLLAYATAPGSVASDGEGANGLYTRELLTHIRTPNLGVEEVFKRVRVGVLEKSGGKQTPWEASSLTGDLYFTTAAAAPEAVPPAPETNAAAVELSFWDSVKQSGNPDDYRAYLRRYPAGAFAEIANNRLAAAPAAERTGASPAPASQTAQQYAANGAALYKKKKYAQAEIEYRLAARLEPDNAAHHSNLAEVLRKQKKVSEAEAALKEVVRLAPGSARYRFELALFYHAEKMYQAAEIELRRVVQLEPANAAYHFSLAATLIKLNRRAEALAALESAVKFDPSNARYRVEYEAVKRQAGLKQSGDGNASSTIIK